MIYAIGTGIDSCNFWLWQFEKTNRGKINCVSLNFLSPQLEEAKRMAVEQSGQEVCSVADLPSEYFRAWTGACNELKKALLLIQNDISRCKNQIITHDSLVAKIKRKIVPFGTYKDQTFDQLPIHYVNWIKTTQPSDEIMALYVTELLEYRKNDFLPTPSQSYIGTVKEELICEGTIVRVNQFASPYGGSVWYTSIVEDTVSAFVLTKTTSCLGEVGKRIKIKGVVSKHEPYRKQNQTVLSRVKIL